METIGFLELNSIAKDIEAADTMLKAAEVRLIAARPSCPGKYHVLITGEVAAVQSSMPERANAVGILEFFSVTASLYGADAAVKAADVTLLEVRLGTGIGGKSFVVLTGDVSAVPEGVEAGAASAGDSDLLVNRVVIPSPHLELFESFY